MPVTSSDDAMNTSNRKDETALTDSRRPLLTPHTRRLLKLIEEGSADHTRIAVTHLKKITVSVSPLILWEILGRLQGFLVSPEWNTRSNAGIAMEGVAQHLSIADQESFLSQRTNSHSGLSATTDNTNGIDGNDSTSLKISDLEGNVTNILANGQLLVATAESRYQTEEYDDELELLDQCHQGDAKFCEMRLEMQRRILTRRIGLSTILADHTTDCDQLKTQLIDREAVESSVSNTTNLNQEKTPSTSRTYKKKKKDRKTSKKTRLAIGKLLTGIWRRGLQQQQEHQGTENESSVTIHRNAQSILAGELIFRMFDPSWYVRHGSLIGILALVRAWKVHHRKSDDVDLGVWPQDILARSLCILALDRFGDFSGASAEAISGGTVAPIREMAGQVFAVVFLMAPNSLRQKVLHILNEMFYHDEWEVRHGVLIAIKYTMVLVTSAKTSNEDCQLDSQFLTSFMNHIVSGLRDRNDDIQAVAAQILGFSFDPARGGEKNLIPHMVQSLWQSLQNIRVVSSSINDLVKLLSKLVRTNLSAVLDAVPNSNSFLEAWAQVFNRTKELLECELVSVKISILDVMASLSTRCIELVDAEKNESNKLTAASSFCVVVKAIYNLSFETSKVLQEDNANSSDDTTDLRILKLSCSETWAVLSEISCTVLGEHESLQNDLHYYLLVKYFDSENILKTSCIASYIPIMDRAASLGRFLRPGKTVPQEKETKQCNKRNDILEFFLFSHMDSPFIVHCEATCLLIQGLFKFDDRSSYTSENAHITPTIEACEKRLLYKLETGTISKLDHNSLHVTHDSGIIKAITTSLNIGYKMVCEEGVSGKVAGAAVVELWKEIELFFDEDSTCNVTVDSMRLSSHIVGTLIAGGIQFLPQKMTPVVRPLMTSVQNEHNDKWRMTVCSYIERFLTLISNEPKSSLRFEGFRRTFSKVLANLCNLLIAGKEPSCISSSITIGLIVSKLQEKHSLRDLEAVWTFLLPLRESLLHLDFDATMNALKMMKAVCQFLNEKSSVTATIFDDYMHSLTNLGCCEQLVIRDLASTIIQRMCSVDISMALDKILPSLILFLQDGENDTRRYGACMLLHKILDSAEFSVAVCPYIKALLPIVMSMMIDPVKVCAETSARTFSLLVQVAPLVNDSVPIVGSQINEEANLVIDHLIHGKKLKPCSMHPKIAQALREKGIVLRNYQHEGLSWLRFLQRINLNGALCDSMGLGKTLQATVAVSLAHMDNSDRRETKSLVICPSSIVGHWVNEIHRYFPRDLIFRPLAIEGNGQQRQYLLDNEMESYNLIVASYETLRSNIDSLSKVNWTYCVLDEGHLLRNPKTATAKASRRLRARHKLILTGTPIQNSVEEIWATFDFLMPSFLGSSSQFSKEFAKPIIKGQNLDAAPITIAAGLEKLKLLHQQVLPFILRREKEQVLSELPPKVITRIPCPMSSIQKRLYSLFCSGQLGKQSISTLNSMIDMKHAPVGDDSTTFNTGAFKALLYLRLLCTHPWLVRKKEDFIDPQMQESLYDLQSSGKLIALKELLRDAGFAFRELTAADNDMSLIYCGRDEDQMSDTDDHEKILMPDCQDSSGDELRQHQLNRQESRCLIFAQFTQSLDIVEELLIKRYMPSMKYLRLDGKVPVPQRTIVVDKFNRDESFKLLLLTTKIGGLGLNITGADTVIFLEHDWNPHSDLQAMDRAHRIGQKRTVHVYQLVTMNSIEEKTMMLQERKLAMSNAIINTNNSSMYSMGTDCLLDIFQFRSESASSAKSSHTDFDIDNTIDTLVERYQDEYKSLSLRDFLAGFEPTQKK